jgi:hypothetical protein
LAKTELKTLWLALNPAVLTLARLFATVSSAWVRDINPVQAA